MEDKLQDVILSELKSLRDEVRQLNTSHLKLENKVYLISISLGLISGELKNLVEKLLGM